MLTQAPAADPIGSDFVPETVAIERLAPLREALEVPRALNGILTREFLRSVQPAAVTGLSLSTGTERAHTPSPCA